MNGLFIIACASVCNTFALVLLKMAGKQMAPGLSLWLFLHKSWILVLGGMILYGLSFVLTIKILADNTFFTAVPIFVGINFFFTVIVSLFIFKESIMPSSLFGIGFIFLGVWLISTSTL